jgi:hypothetical protein
VERSSWLRPFERGDFKASRYRFFAGSTISVLNLSYALAVTYSRPILEYCLPVSGSQSQPILKSRGTAVFTA